MADGVEDQGPQQGRQGEGGATLVWSCFILRSPGARDGRHLEVDLCQRGDSPGHGDRSQEAAKHSGDRHQDREELLRATYI